MESSDFFDFVHDHALENPLNLKLKYTGKHLGFNINDAIIQIECRRKYNLKLKDFILERFFLFPDNISAEQASHQAVAQYHATLTNKNESILDMTAGLGIDAMSFARNCKSVTALELDLKKATILKGNAETFNLKNFNVIVGNSVDYIMKTTEYFDIIFIDPARRDKSNKRLYGLNDCTPNVLDVLNIMKERSSRILIKASPLLDIKKTVSDVTNIASIKAIGVKGECKELLIEIISDSRQEINNSILLEAINLNQEGNIISDFSVNYHNNFSLNKEIVNEGKSIPYAEIKDIMEGGFILEPSAMIMKLSPWKDICHRFVAKKLDKSSHLFVSKKLPVDFPGRVTQFYEIIKNNDRKSFEGFPASVISRNYPLSSDDLRKKFRLKEGDSNFIYATRISNKPIIFLCKSLN